MGCSCCHPPAQPSEEEDGAGQEQHRLPPLVLNANLCPWWIVCSDPAGLGELPQLQAQPLLGCPLSGQRGHRLGTPGSPLGPGMEDDMVPLCLQPFLLWTRILLLQ